MKDMKMQAIADDALMGVTGGSDMSGEEPLVPEGCILKNCPVCGGIKPFRQLSGGREVCTGCSENRMIM